MRAKGCFCGHSEALNREGRWIQTFGTMSRHLIMQISKEPKKAQHIYAQSFFSEAMTTSQGSNNSYLMLLGKSEELQLRHTVK